MVSRGKLRETFLINSGMASLFNTKGHRITAALLIAAVALILLPRNVQAQQIALKTNALLWAALSPNLSCEIVAGEHSSVDLSLYGHYKPYGIDSRMAGFLPEYKYWFNGRPLTREFIGVGLLLTTYDITWKRNVYDGDALGLGITGGYVFSLGRRWNLELSAGFGIVGFAQKQYYRNDNYDDYPISTETNAWGYKLLPFELGVSFSYIIK